MASTTTSTDDKKIEVTLPVTGDFHAGKPVHTCANCAYRFYCGGRYSVSGWFLGFDKGCDCIQWIVCPVGHKVGHLDFYCGDACQDEDLADSDEDDLLDADFYAFLERLSKKQDML